MLNQVFNRRDQVLDIDEHLGRALREVVMPRSLCGRDPFELVEPALGSEQPVETDSCAAVSSCTSASCPRSRRVTSLSASVVPSLIAPVRNSTSGEACSR